jgi:hypothetical protein
VSLTEQLSRVQKEKEALKAENSNILSKQATLIAESRKVAQHAETASETEQENAKLKALISQLKANQVVPAVGAATNNKDQAAMMAQIRTLEDQKDKLQSALDEWTELAKVCALRIPFSNTRRLIS